MYTPSSSSSTPSPRYIQIDNLIVVPEDGSQYDCIMRLSPQLLSSYIRPYIPVGHIICGDSLLIPYQENQIIDNSQEQIFGNRFIAKFHTLFPQSSETPSPSSEIFETVIRTAANFEKFPKGILMENSSFFSAFKVGHKTIIMDRSSTYIIFDFPVRSDFSPIYPTNERPTPLPPSVVDISRLFSDYWKRKNIYHHIKCPHSKIEPFYQPLLSLAQGPLLHDVIDLTQAASTRRKRSSNSLVRDSARHTVTPTQLFPENFKLLYPKGAPFIEEKLLEQAKIFKLEKLTKEQELTITQFNEEIKQNGIPSHFKLCNIPDIGNGIFLDPGSEDIKRGAVIGLYTGDYKFITEDSESVNSYNFDLLEEPIYLTKEEYDTHYLQIPPQSSSSSIRSQSRKGSNKDKKEVYFVIDAFENGNYTRYINHSYKTPNVEAILTSLENGMPVILLTALRKISPGEQLLLNYKKSYWQSLKINPSPLKPKTFTLTEEGLIKDDDSQETKKTKTAH